MDIKYFFSFGSEPLSSTIQVSLVGSIKDIMEFDDIKLSKGNYEGFHFPMIFKQKYGRKRSDILDTGFPSFYLISERMKMILEENCLTGWKTFPVKIYDKKGVEIPDYYGLSIIGRSGPTSFEKSQVIEKRKIETGPLCKFYKGIFLTEWDGSDFFIPEGTAHIFITKKVADVLKSNKITNMDLTNLAEYEISESSVHLSKRKPQ